MSKPEYTEFQRYSAELIRSILGSSPSESTLWNVVGKAGAGKSAFLYSLRSHLTERQVPTVFVSAAAGSLDAAPSVLLQIGAGLSLAGRADVDLLSLQELGRPTTEKLKDVERWMASARSERFVFLWDEPYEQVRTAGEENRFSEFLSLVYHTLLTKTACLHVVSGTVPLFRKPRETFHLRGVSDAGAVARDATAWGSLLGEAEAIGRRAGSAAANWSVPEWKLRVALAGVQEKVRPAVSAHFAFADLADQLAKNIGGNPQWGELRDIWARMALVRGLLPRDLATVLGGDALTGIEADLLWKGLLEERGGQWAMHRALRSAALLRRWLDERRVRDVHRLIADYYVRSERQRKADDPQRPLDRLEAFHHLAEIGEAEPSLAMFEGQLDSLGRSLSLAGDYESAVRVFEQAVQINALDDYAHHYTAYNLDIQGKEPARVEAEYRLAIDIDPKNDWWRSRLITFLITLGRTEDARREWSEAIEALVPPGNEAPAVLCENLHLWVARLLVHRARLDFARAVLDLVPQEVRETHLGFREIDRLCQALGEARCARVVFPAWIPPDQWWHGPWLLAKRRSGKPLKAWYPGRVEAVDDETVTLVIASSPPQGEKPAEYGYVTIPVEQFNRETLDDYARDLRAGRFVELGFYGDGTPRRIRIYRDVQYADSDLPALKMDPQRYLRTEGRVR